MKNHDVTASNCLRHWAHWLDGLADQITAKTSADHWQCIVDLPSGRNVVGVGDDASLAVRNLLKELVEQLPAPPVMRERGSAEDVPLPILAAQPTNQEKPMQPKDVGQRMDTKARRETIGVTTKKSFHAAIGQLAQQRAVSKAELARDLLRDGLERFERDMETKNPSSLLRNYEQAAKSYEGDTEQWVIRLDRPWAKWVRMTAKEFEKSTSQIACFLLAESLRHEQAQPATAVQSKIPSAPSPADLEQSVIVINSWLPPKRARELACRSSLGNQRDLICQVLQGEIIAPAKVIGSISTHTEVPIELLVAAFASNFQNRTVPMFKATHGKPQMAAAPHSWSDAVKALKLPADEEQALLALES